MNIAYDIFAETNPGFCSLALASFVSGYEVETGRPPDLISAYFVLPISLSQDLAHTFDGTNKNTGLIVWLGRNPEIKLSIAERVRSTMSISNEAIRFGCFSGTLRIDQNGRIANGEKAVKTTTLFTKAGPTAERAFKMSQRLGSWFGSVGTSKSIFNSFGVVS